MHPKPFMQLQDGQSLLQKTFQRALALRDTREVVTVTNREFFFKTADEFDSVNRTRKAHATFMLEPFGRNTAAAVAAATLQVQKEHGDNALVLVMPADHLIADQVAFQQAVTQAMNLAGDDYIVTFGIQPDRPETGFGYVQYNGHKVERFVEKPDVETASQYIRTGKYVWNSGMFCFKVSAMLGEMRILCPKILEATQAALEGARVSGAEGRKQIELDASLFAKVPEDSVDYAVMERTKTAAVVPCNIGWSDIGSWNAVSELSPPDDRGNRTNGRTVLHDTQDCYFQSERLVGAVGVQDLVVIDTPDALLIANRNRTQDVKQIFTRLKASGDETHKLHRTVHRPWGSYSVLEEGRNFKIKRIEVKPNASLSLQMHHHRSEHWIVVSGSAEVVNGEALVTLGPNQSTYIPAGSKHRLANRGKIDLVMIEVQSGEYLGEDDIVRFEDLYGRA